MAKKLKIRNKKVVHGRMGSPTTSTIKSPAIAQARSNETDQQKVLTQDENALMEMPTSFIGNSSMFESIADIPLSQINFNRGHRSDRAIERLRLSISFDDLIHPIVVREENGRYEVVCGLRRVEACISLKRMTIPARVLRKNVSTQDQLKLRLVENLYRENFKPVELAMAISDFVEESLPGINSAGIINLFNNEQRKSKRLSSSEATVVSKVKDITGRSMSTIRNLLSLLKFPSGIRDQIEREEISASNAYILAPHCEDKDFDNIVCQVIDKKLTRNDLKKLFEPKSQSETCANPFLIKLNSLEGEVRNNINQFSPEELTILKDKTYLIFNMLQQQITTGGASTMALVESHDQEDQAIKAELNDTTIIQ